MTGYDDIQGVLVARNNGHTGGYIQRDLIVFVVGIAKSCFMV